MWLWLSHQVVDVPPVLAEVTEYQCYGGRCEDCGTVNVAEMPPEAAGCIVGTRLQAIASVLSGRFRLSRREVEEALVQLFGPKADLALGTISNLEAETSAALSPVYEEAHQAAQKAPRANFDETGWREGRKKAWLWAMVTSFLSVFRIDLHRNKDAFKAIAGSFKGILSSDRWRTYMKWLKHLHQLCCAHLNRDFKSWKDLGGREGKLGAAALECEREIMALWHRFKNGEISRSTLRQYLRPVQKRLKKILRRGTRRRLIAGTCKELLKFWTCLWVFTRVPGVEPTNNVGEQEIRRAVLWPWPGRRTAALKRKTKLKKEILKWIVGRTGKTRDIFENRNVHHCRIHFSHHINHGRLLVQIHGLLQSAGGGLNSLLGRTQNRRRRNRFKERRDPSAAKRAGDGGGEDERNNLGL